MHSKPSWHVDVQDTTVTDVQDRSTTIEEDVSSKQEQLGDSMSVLETIDDLKQSIARYIRNCNPTQ